LRQVILCWLSKADLPRDTYRYKRLLKRYKDLSII
jgi:hypothetical protein